MRRRTVGAPAPEPAPAPIPEPGDIERLEAQQAALARALAHLAARFAEPSWRSIAEMLTLQLGVKRADAEAVEALATGKRRDGG